MFKLANSSDQVTVKNWFADTSAAFQIEQISFADGTTWTNAQVTARALVVNGTDAADTLVGVYAFADQLNGGAGNDTLTAAGSGDTLNGGAGDDVLNGNGYDGATYIGGAGNDTITGAYMADTYVFNRGDGQDIVTDFGPSYYGGGPDALNFGPDVASDQLWFRHVGNDLEVDVIGTSDRVTIAQWYSGSGNHVERFQAGDGKVLLDSDVNSLVEAMASFAPPVAGQTTLAPDYRTNLQPVIASAWHGG